MFGFPEAELDNKKTSIPHAECRMPNRLNGASYFSAIDLGNAYYQVELDHESQEKNRIFYERRIILFHKDAIRYSSSIGNFPSFND